MSRFFLSPVLLLLLLSPSLLAQAPWSGEGTARHPYLITSVTDLHTLSQSPEHWSNHFRLAEDLSWSDLENEEFTPIGSLGRSFSGSFDGQGHTLTGFSLELERRGQVGLFGSVSGAVRNLSLAEVEVEGRDCHEVGALVGRLAEDGMVVNCHVRMGSVRVTQTSSRERIGGLIGVVHGEGAVRRCTASCSVYGALTVGGLIGLVRSEGQLSECRASGQVTAAGQDVGGLVGTNFGSIEQSGATGAVSGTNNVGGFVGLNHGTILQSFGTGAVTGSSYGAGGFVGSNSDHLALIKNCYARGAVVGQAAVGSFAGSAFESAPDTGILFSYGSGKVTGEERVGGFSGDTEEGYRSRASLWDREASGQVRSPGPERGEPTARMQDIHAYAEDSWDFTDIWGFIGEEPDYPRLKWEGEVRDTRRLLVAEGSVWLYKNTPLGQPRSVQSWRRDVGGIRPGVPQGMAPFGYGKEGLATVLDFGDADNKPITWHFRHQFEVRPPVPAVLELWFRRDDSALIHVNGIEVFRDNLPEGEINDETRALDEYEGAIEDEWYGVAVPATMLNSLGNVITVEIHQFAPTDPDAVFDLRLYGVGLGNPDTDGNGIDDEWELKHTGRVGNLTWGEGEDRDGLNLLQEFLHDSDPRLFDTDGDGFGDGYEVTRGSNPARLGSVPTVLETVIDPPEERETFDFGRFVTISGNRVAVSYDEPQEEGRRQVIGIYRRHYGESGWAWTSEAVLAPPNLQRISSWGYRMDLHGGTLVVGAAGFAYVFERDGTGRWTEVAKLEGAEDGFENFGKAVAVHGRTILVGASRGRLVYVFHRKRAGWELVDRLRPPNDEGKEFGAAVALDGSSALVGAPSASRAFVFQRKWFSDQWRRVATLQKPEIENFHESSYSFGERVALHGGVAVVAGVPEDPGGDGTPVPAYVYHRHEGGWNDWGFVSALWSDDGGIFYANSFDVGNGVIAVETDDSLFVFRRRHRSPEPWVLDRRFIPAEGRLTGNVALSGNTIATGATLGTSPSSRVLTIPVVEAPRVEVWLKAFLTWWRERGGEPDPALALAGGQLEPDEVHKVWEAALKMSSAEAQFGTTMVSAEEYLTMTFTLPDPLPPGAIVDVQSSPDLRTWTSVAKRDPVDGWSGMAPVSEQLGTLAQRVITVRDVVPLAQREQGYLRLAVSVSE